ncbi:serine/threonine-protein kinase [Streptomyces sp. NPDC001595]|uniref:serine/threonine-protein kinase n=1 Tax=Streptomyces sp. NPDC001532 TaxID=3154520 RepID=UPI003328EA32
MSRGPGVEPLEDEDPRRIGPVPLLGRLGAGGMGRVYLGVHEGRYAAVKQLRPSVVGEDKDFVRRFGHELDNLARLPATATAPLLAGDREARPPWFATAYVPGLTLYEALVRYGGPLPARALWTLLREAASALAAVHALDMVHRDLKPSNVMLTRDGLTLIDFGVARAAEQSQLTRTGMVVGTPAYMSPEQASGARLVTGAVDVFALGSVLAFAACGRPPFGDDSGHGVLYRIVHEQPDLAPLRELDTGLAEAVAACLDKDPEGRPTAVELLELAEDHGPFETPLWPEPVAGELSERAEFAATVPDPEDLPSLTAPTLGEPGPRPPSQSPPESSPPSPPQRRERRRTRVVLAVVPVVVVATTTTLALQYLPHDSGPRDRARATPTAAVSSPAAPTPTGPAARDRPSEAESPGERRSASPGKGEADKAGTGDGGGGAVGGGPVPADGPAGSAGGGSGSSGGSSGTGGSGSGSGGSGSASGGATGTFGGSGGSGGSTGTSPTAAPSPASSRYRNGDDGSCLSQVYGAASTGGCSGSGTSWTVRTASGGFRLVNQRSGACLAANTLGQAVFVNSCDGSGSQLWRSGSGGSLVNAANGGCLDLGMNSGVVTAACAGQASQRWSAV